MLSLTGMTAALVVAVVLGALGFTYVDWDRVVLGAILLAVGWGALWWIMKFIDER